MKTIVSLSAKYMRRQKMRTVLTFCSIVLSVFIFMTLCNAFIVMRGLILGTEIMPYEADLGIWLNQYETAEERAQATETIRNHIAVEKSYLRNDGNISADSKRDENGYMAYFSVQTDNGKTAYYSTIISQQETGSRSLVLSDYYYLGTDRTALQPNEIVLPTEYQDMGYKEGDSITLTITPCTGKITDDAACIQKMAKEIREEAEALGKDLDELPLFHDSGNNPSGKSIADNSLFVMATSSKYIDRISLEFQDVSAGTPYTYSAVIKGFDKRSRMGLGESRNNLPLITGYDSDFSLGNLDTYTWPDASENVEAFSYYNGSTAMITVPKNLNFDKAMEQLFDDMKVPCGNGEYDLSREELIYPRDTGRLYNVGRLALEFRGTAGITSWLLNQDGDTDKYVMLLLMLVLTFLVWLVMRFVIDNAFEISVQERSAQFATLRIMGATRRQITELVGTEALYYSLFAIPLGVLLSYIAKRIAVSTLEGFGLTVERASFLPLTVIGIALALFAVYISAYTSSMWAAHAYAPLEAAKRTKLKGNKKETIWNKPLFGTKSWDEKIEAKLQKEAARRNPAGGLKAPKTAKLDRNQKSFLRYYTRRNINRNRRRFIISVITMSIGVLLFTLGASLGGFAALIAYEEQMFSDPAEDFYIYTDYNPGTLDYFEQRFSDNANYRAANASVVTYIPLETKSYLQAGSGILLDDRDFVIEYNQVLGTNQNVDLVFIARDQYEQDYADKIGMTYEEFAAARSSVIVMDWRGGPDRTNYDIRGNYLSTDGEVYEQGWYPFAEPVSVKASSDAEIPVSGILITDTGNAHASLLSVSDSAEEMLGNLIDSYAITQSDYYMTTPSTILELYLTDSSVYESAKTELENFRSFLLNQGNEYVDFEDNFLAATGLVLIIRAIVIACVLVLLAVWLTGIFTMVNTINTGVLNRCDELMMLRTVGMTKKQLRKIITSESSYYCAVSTVIGGILGISVMLFFAAALVINTALSPWLFIAILFGVVAATLLLNLLIARLAARPGLRALDERMEQGGMLQ